MEWIGTDQFRQVDTYSDSSKWENWAESETELILGPRISSKSYPLVVFVFSISE